MTLGFDMADPIVDPSNISDRTTDWIEFFNKWNQKPIFAGRYFGRTDNNWVTGEVPSNLKTLVQNNFDNFQYIVPFSPPGYWTSNKQVNIYGDFVNNGFVYFFEQAGTTRDGIRISNTKIYEKGKKAAMATCFNIVTRLKEWGPWSRPRSTRGDYRLPIAKKIFVFLDVEPQTKLHKKFWQGWADTILTYPAYLGEVGNKLQTQAFLPCIYCAMDIDGPWLSEIQDIFNDDNMPRCYALMTPWNPRPPGVIFEEDESGASGISAYDATEEIVKTNIPNFGTIKHNRYPDATVRVWQYKINIKYKTGFEIDFAITTDDSTTNRPITDCMLEINW